MNIFRQQGQVYLLINGYEEEEEATLNKSQLDHKNHCLNRQTSAKMRKTWGDRKKLRLESQLCCVKVSWCSCTYHHLMEDLKLKPWMKKICPDLYIPVINSPRIRDKLKAVSKISKRVIICGDFSKKVSWIRPQQSISLLQERPMCFPSIDKHLLIGYSVCVRTHLFLGLISLLSLPPRLTTLWVHFLQGPALIQCSEFTIGQT